MPESATVRGRAVVLWLFVALAASTTVALLLCAFFVDPMYRGTVYFALGGDLALPVAAWFVFRGIAERGALRAFWFSTAAAAALATVGVSLALLTWGGLLGR